MLKMSGIKLKLISNTDMHWFVEKGMRGGISQIEKRYSKANNRYITDYERSEESKFSVYLDANNS